MKEITDWGTYKLDRALELVVEMIERIKADPGSIADTVTLLVDIRESLIEAQGDIR